MLETTQPAFLTRTRRRIVRDLKRLPDDSKGATFIEYIIVVGLVAIIAIAAFNTFGKTVVNKLKEETNGLEQLQPAG
jgi:Flp pilus assembly pilin Flp